MQDNEAGLVAMAVVVTMLASGADGDTAMTTGVLVMLVLMLWDWWKNKRAKRQGNDQG